MAYGFRTQESQAGVLTDHRPHTDSAAAFPTSPARIPEAGELRTGEVVDAHPTHTEQIRYEEDAARLDQEIAILEDLEREFGPPPTPDAEAAKARFLQEIQLELESEWREEEQHLSPAEHGREKVGAHPIEAGAELTAQFSPSELYAAAQQEYARIRSLNEEMPGSYSYAAADGRVAEYCHELSADTPEALAVARAVQHDVLTLCKAWNDAHADCPDGDAMKRFQQEAAERKLDLDVEPFLPDGTYIERWQPGLETHIIRQPDGTLRMEFDRNYYEEAA